MTIDISGRHNYVVSDMLKAYVLDKMNRLEKFSLKIESAHVVLEQEKVNATCEIVLVGKSIRLTAKETTKVMQASFDAAVSKIANQLRRQHDKLSHRSHDKMHLENDED